MPDDLRKEIRFCQGFDGARLQVTLLGDGPPLLLLHGLFSSAETNWLRYGTARTLAAAGFGLIMPDFRGHGGSDAPADPAAWPEDVLARDIEALLPQLELADDVVIGGYSLGARTVVRLLARGLQPRAAVLGGMGLNGIIGGAERGRWFIRMIEGRGTWERGTPEFMAEAFMKAGTPNPDAIVHLLRGQVSTAEARLRTLSRPTLVVCGVDDQDNGAAPELASILPRATYADIPGNHMSAVTRPELATEILRFLQGL